MQTREKIRPQLVGASCFCGTELKGVIVDRDNRNMFDPVLLEQSAKINGAWRLRSLPVHQLTEMGQFRRTQAKAETDRGNAESKAETGKIAMGRLVFVKPELFKIERVGSNADGDMRA